MMCTALFTCNNARETIVGHYCNELAIAGGQTRKTSEADEADWRIKWQKTQSWPRNGNEEERERYHVKE
eukprot:3276557-Pleurochrysis_carterae.AAC.1